jgi:hypothetical protein
MISTISKIVSISDLFSLSIIFIIVYTIQYYYNYFTRTWSIPNSSSRYAHQKIGLEQNDWWMSLHKKYGDIFEINLAGGRLIILCRTDLVENINITSTKTKYPFKRIVTKGIMEYLKCGINGSGIILNMILIINLGNIIVNFLLKL